MPAGESHIDPDVVRAGAERLLAAGERARDRVTDLCHRLRVLEAERPWGSDGPGAAFEAAYQPSARTADASQQILLLVIEMSSMLRTAANRMEQADRDVADAFGTVNGGNGSSPYPPGAGNR